MHDLRRYRRPSDESVQKLREMCEYGRPSHQYFDPDAEGSSSPVVLVSLLEYDDAWLLRMKDDASPPAIASADRGSQQHEH